MASAWDHIDILGAIEKGRQLGAQTAGRRQMQAGDYEGAAATVAPFDAQLAQVWAGIGEQSRQRKERTEAQAFDRDVAPMIARGDIRGATDLAITRKRDSATVMRMLELGRTMDNDKLNQSRQRAARTAIALRQMETMTPEQRTTQYAALRERMIAEDPSTAQHLPEAYDPRIAQNLMMASVDAKEALDMIVAERKAELGRFQTLTPAEVAQRGYRPGTIVQVNPATGEENVRQSPRDTSGSGDWRPMTPAEITAYNMRPGTSALIDDRTGNVKKVEGPRTYNEGESLAASFAARARAAIIELREAEKMPGFRIEETLNPATTNPAAQRWLGAARDMINAQLRRESGAAIGPSEFSSARRQYLLGPLDWNNADVRKAKYNRLNNMYRAFVEESNGAYEERYGEPGTTQNPIIGNDGRPVIRTPGGTAPAGTPPKPDNVPANAVWDAQRQMWTLNPGRN